MDAVEDAAADVAGALEGVGALPSHQDGLLARPQAASQPLVARVAEQAPADGGHADERGVEVDEGVVRVAGLGVVGGGLVAAAGEGLVHLADGEVQPPDGAVADQAVPVAHLAGTGGERRRRLRLGLRCARRGSRGRGAQPPGPE